VEKNSFRKMEKQTKRREKGRVCRSGKEEEFLKFCFAFERKGERERTVKSSVCVCVMEETRISF